MLIVYISLVIGLSSSLTYKKTSSEVLPIYCTATGWSTTKNITTNSYLNEIPDASWV